MTRTQAGIRLDCLVCATLSSSQPLPLVRLVTRDTPGEASPSPVYRLGRSPGLDARRVRPAVLRLGPLPARASWRFQDQACQTGSYSQPSPASSLGSLTPG